MRLLLGAACIRGQHLFHFPFPNAAFIGGGIYKRGRLKEEIPSITAANQYQATFYNKCRNMPAVLIQKAFNGMVNWRR